MNSLIRTDVFMQNHYRNRAMEGLKIEIIMY